MEMNRMTFREHFGKAGQVVLPVVHVLSDELTIENVRLLIAGGADDCWLINHHFEAEQLIPIVKIIRSLWPNLWLGVNFLGMRPQDVFALLKSLEKDGTRTDGYWADDAGLDVTSAEQKLADTIDKSRSTSGWNGLYFGGVAFKYRETFQHLSMKRSRILRHHTWMSLRPAGPKRETLQKGQKLVASDAEQKIRRLQLRPE